MMHFSGKAGFTLIELSLVMVLLAVLALIGFRFYKGYTLESKARMLGIEIVKLKQFMAEEAKEMGVVQWSQYFNKKGYSNPVQLPRRPALGRLFTVGYGACGANFPGLDCLSITVSGIDPDGVIDNAIADHIDGSVVSCQHSDIGEISCLFLEP